MYIYFSFNYTCSNRALFQPQFSSSLTTHKTFTLDSRAVTSDTRGKHLKALFIRDKSCYYSDALYSILVNGPRGIIPISYFLKMKLNTTLFRISSYSNFNQKNSKQIPTNVPVSL